MNSLSSFKGLITYQLIQKKEFRNFHQIPAAITFKNVNGTMITFKTKDGKTTNGYFVKSEKQTNKFVFVFHEWWGLNDYKKKNQMN